MPDPSLACPDWALTTGFKATCDDLPPGFIAREPVYAAWRAGMLSGSPRPGAEHVSLLPPASAWPPADKLFICDQGWADDPRQGTLAHLFLRTATSRALAAWRHKREDEVRAAFPFRRYVAVADRRTHPDHLALHGVVLLASDPWWNRNLPPKGWGCRCTTINLNARTLERRGWSVTVSPPGR